MTPNVTRKRIAEPETGSVRFADCPGQAGQLELAVASPPAVGRNSRPVVLQVPALPPHLRDRAPRGRASDQVSIAAMPSQSSLHSCLIKVPTADYRTTTVQFTDAIFNPVAVILVHTVHM